MSTAPAIGPGAVALTGFRELLAHDGNADGHPWFSGASSSLGFPVSPARSLVADTPESPGATARESGGMNPADRPAARTGNR